MAFLTFFIFICLFMIRANTHFSANEEEGFISVEISQKGLDFTKDLLIKQAISSLTPLALPKIQISKKIPLLGVVDVVLSNITINRINVVSSYVKPGDTGIAIVASGATANISMNWNYTYSTWVFFPIKISDEGTAFVQVEGMEVGLTLGLENQGGTLKLSLEECGCDVKTISIKLNGGASWFYQGFVDAFEGQIRSAVESTISKKIKEGTVKLDSFLQTLPREIPVDGIASLNVTFVNDPALDNSSIGLKINGLFTAANSTIVHNYYHRSYQPSVSCKGPVKMLGISLDEEVFTSAADVYFNAESMKWIVEKIPEQSLLNTASWKLLVPQLYKKYPNDDMKLNVSFTSPPVIRILSDKIDATIYADMIIDVLEASEIIPVACISMVAHVSGSVKISKNNLVGGIGLNDLSLSLKWSDVGKFHMTLIQSVMWTFMKTVALPYANLRLREGFPLPIIRGFTLRDANIAYLNSQVLICSDVIFTDEYNFEHPMLYNH